MQILKKEALVRDNKYLIIVASVMGPDKIENQDSFNIYTDDNQLIVTLADGLGSAIYSKEGSSKIVNVATNILLGNYKEDKIPLLILKQWQSVLDGNLNLYDTTLKFLKINNDEICYGGVGDGWISINNDNIIDLCSNNIFSNQTDSILSFNLEEKFIINKTKNSFKNLLIATDGFSEDIDKSLSKKFMEDIHSQICDDVDLFLDNLSKVLNNWPVKTNRDDKTVIIIQRMEK